MSQFESKIKELYKQARKLPDNFNKGFSQVGEKYYDKKRQHKRY